ncbi:MAG TPA: folylpolyglutamate synthase/dihydrofolate synthase family protein, partial [Longimicrobiales bacterium]|nr:folylpolyglutamate synthase/dihydrofolate synthase family protein [Longimicrobiales bacterium]
MFPRLTGGIRWGLERTKALLAQAGNPQDRFWTIHVGGTNGKGSVAATIANILSAAGYRTGLYTSPHLCSFRERIRVDGVPISEADLVAAAMPLWPALESSGASFFEATTVLGLAALARAHVDCAVVEVGLGGRLDSTNVITPELAIITNIAFDHAEYLGHTLEAIATEKAGIMKPGVPLVTAETQPAVLRVLESCALESRADLYACAPMTLPDPSLSGNRIAVDTTCWGRLEVETPLIGRHQARNLSLAVQSLDRIGRRFELTEAAVVRGARTVRWPGRFQVERIGTLHWVFDVAHNEAGVHALAETFNELALTRPVALLVGILGDKDWRRMLPPLFALADSIFLAVPPTAPANRAWHPEQVLAAVPA